MKKLKFVFNSKIPVVLKVEAITILPYIYFRKSEEETSLRVIKHELVHYHQCSRIGWTSFYGSYLLYYFAGLWRSKSHYWAYMNIPYEREAYEDEHLPLTEEDKKVLDEIGYTRHNAELES